MKLKKEQVMGILRHVLTFAGGILVTKGLVDETIWAETSGSVITLVGAIWSILSKK